MSQEPYIKRMVREYNPDYGDDRVCQCGHTYDRHFDGYEGNAPVGCKYCTSCGTFKEASVDQRPVVLTKKDLLQYGKLAIIRNGDDLFDTPSHVALPLEYIEEVTKAIGQIRKCLERGVKPSPYQIAAFESLARIAAEVEAARDQHDESRRDERAAFNDQRGF